MRFSIYQESQIGGRATNQDRMGYCFTKDALLLLLADGMGGHVGGEIAAGIVLQTLGACFNAEATPRLASPQDFLENAFFAAHREIQRYSLDHHLPESPRTTIVACVIQDGQAVWAHCGDSRLYWMRKGAILMCTRDHSNIETLIAQGKALASERATHPERNRLFNCLGAPALPKVDMAGPVTLLPGDLLLLCSDGLWATVAEETLVQELHANTIVRAVPTLVRLATEAGGRHGDNVTALALTWDGADDPEVVEARARAAAELAAAEEFSDVDIEKAVAEIRAAIDLTGRLPRKS